MSKLGLIDINDHRVLPDSFEYLGNVICGLLVCRKAEGDPFGYIDLHGRPIIPSKFKMAFPFEPMTGLAIVLEHKDGTECYGMIDLGGNYVLKPVYADLRLPREGLSVFASFAHHGRMGFCDVTGNVAIPPSFDYATDFSCGLAAVTYPDEPDKTYFIDRRGKKVLGPFHGRAGDQSGFKPEGIATVRNPDDKRVYYINPLGKEVLRPARHLHVGEFYCGLADAFDRDTKKFGFVDISGKFVLPAKYDSPSQFIRGYAIVACNEKWGVIDSRGNEVASMKYASPGLIDIPSCGRIRFCEPARGGPQCKFGFMSLYSNDVCIPAKYTYAHSFSEGFAVVSECD
jgi:hypothetical protein